MVASCHTKDFIMKDFSHYPLVKKAFEECRENFRKAGREYLEEYDASTCAGLEILDKYVDASKAERESLCAAYILIMGGPDPVFSRDISGYADQFNGRVYEIVSELKEGRLDETPSSKTDKGLLQIIAAQQINTYKYFLEPFLNADANEITQADIRYAQKNYDFVYNNSFELPPSQGGIDLGAPRMKDLAREVLSEFRAIINPSFTSAVQKGHKPPLH